MEIINLEGTEDTPKILLDKGNGILKYLEDLCPKIPLNFINQS